MIDLNPPVFRFALREDLKDEKQFIPTRAEPKATGWDVRAAFPDRQSIVVRPFQKIAIPLGIRGFCPDNYWYEIKPRSSSYAKKHLNALYGTIDETYEGELVFACQYIPPVELHNDGVGYVEIFGADYSQVPTLRIDFSDAIAQIIPRLRQEMDVHEIPNSDYDILCKQRDAIRGAGGFGSTGK